jgi:nitrile hydratase
MRLKRTQKAQIRLRIFVLCGLVLLCSIPVPLAKSREAVRDERRSAMGGMQGMGPVQPEQNEPVFHSPWEGRIYAINRAIGAWRKWNIDAGRHQIELIPPADYLRLSLREMATRNIELLVKHGLVTREEIDSANPRPVRPRRRSPLTLSGVPAALEPWQPPCVLSERRGALRRPARARET